MAEAFAQHGNLQPFGAFTEGAHIVAGAGVNSARIIAIGAGNGSQEWGHIFYAVANWAAVIYRIGDRHAAGHWHQSPCGFHAIDAAPAGRSANGTSLVAAERHLHLARGDQGCAAPGRSTGAVLRIMRIADGPGGASMASSGEAQVLAGRLARDRSSIIK